MGLSVFDRPRRKLRLWRMVCAWKRGGRQNGGSRSGENQKGPTFIIVGRPTPAVPLTKGLAHDQVANSWFSQLAARLGASADFWFPAWQSQSAPAGSAGVFRPKLGPGIIRCRFEFSRGQASAVFWTLFLCAGTVRSNEIPLRPSAFTPRQARLQILSGKQPYRISTRFAHRNHGFRAP